jgi:type VI secretion system secreted protein Hcp
MMLSVAPALVDPPSTAAVHQVAVSAQTLPTITGGDPIYMDFGGITGDVTANGYAGDIQLLGFSWGVNNGASAASSGESSAPAISEITVTKALDKASPCLLQEALIGESQDAKIFFVNSVNGELNTYAEYDLKDVLISGYGVSSSGGVPTESLSLNFTKVLFTSFVSNTNGTTTPVTIGWNLSLGEVDDGTIPLRIVVPPGSASVSIADGQVAYNGITVPIADANGVIISTGNGDLTVNIDGPINVPIGLDSVGGVKTVNVRSGTVTFGTDIGAGADISLNVCPGAGVTFGATQHLESLSIASNASAAFAASSRNVLFASDLNIGGTGTTMGTLDLADSDLVLGYTGSSPYDSIRQWVQAGTITGRGIFSSDAPVSPATTIGIVDNAMIHQATWDGQTVSDGSDFNQILTRRTLLGDTNLDGKVDQQDYLNIIANMGRLGATYFEGDLNGDGTVTPDDLAVVSANLGAGMTLAAGPALAAASPVNATMSPMAVSEASPMVDKPAPQTAKPVVHAKKPSPPHKQPTIIHRVTKPT